ncbi:GDSL-type esterase/lipase family protein [uncultured Microbacterium sp.]|uniref:SGNH/GDSL hydrolase family protein n=1 Tax=uncultured Microbacterium sp. TaxID=191216 RepID=UPI0025DC6465|nr:GDSL-type esterase/lipase family protein [uncultured Microbacterium sp.]
MTDLPPLTYGRVVGRFVAGVADSDDAGVVPDVVPLAGSVTFTLSAASLRVVSASPVPTTVYPQPVTATLDADGYLTQNGTRGVSLLATDDPSTNPTDLQYTVTLSLWTPDGNGVNAPSWRFALPGGTEVDLTQVAPIETPAANTIILKGERGDPGPNTIPTVQAVADAVTTDGPARQALLGTIAAVFAADTASPSGVIPTAISVGIEPVKVRARNTFATLGDSILAGDATVSTLQYKDDPGTWLSVLSSATMKYAASGGVAGETTAQIKARVANVLAANPGIVIIDGGTNDVRSYVIGANSSANEANVLNDVFSATNGIPAIVAAVKASGAVPVLMGCPPRGNPGSDLTVDQLAKWRRLVRRVNYRYENYARSQQIPYVDIYNVLVDPATGAYRAAFAHTSGTDGTHPSPAGTAKIAQTIWDAIAPIVPKLTPPLISDASDVTGVFTSNQLFTTTQTGGGGTTPGSWSTVGTFDATATPSVVADPDGFGNRFRVDRSGGVGGAGISRNFTAVAGHRYRIRARVKSSGLRAMVQLFRDSANALRADLGAGTSYDGIVDFVMTPTTGGTTQVQLWTYQGNGYVEFSRVSVIDETDLASA